MQCCTPQPPCSTWLPAPTVQYIALKQSKMSSGQCTTCAADGLRFPDFVLHHRRMVLFILQLVKADLSETLMAGARALMPWRRHLPRPAADGWCLRCIQGMLMQHCVQGAKLSVVCAVSSQQLLTSQCCAVCWHASCHGDHIRAVSL
jgi:hypothetical protein